MFQKNQIRINWHITEACNYQCKGCFAKWGNPKGIWDSSEKVRKVIDSIVEFVNACGTSSKANLNFVGGEPLLSPEKLWEAISYAQKKGLKISLLTNGSHLEYSLPFAHLISEIGLSIDSFQDETNLKIGREENGKTLSFEDFQKKLNRIREVNKDIKIKVNTVVNEFNFSEDLWTDIKRLSEQFNIHKWKILRQMPFDKNPGISDFKFYSFLHNNCNDLNKDSSGSKMPSLPKSDIESIFAMTKIYSKSEPEVFIEDISAMTKSYLMISPDGKLIQNSGSGYCYSRSLLEISFEEALKEISFDEEKYNARYDSSETKQALCNMKKFFKVDKDEKVDKEEYIIL